MSSSPLGRRKSKAAWSKGDDIRLCRSFVLATQDGDGTEHVKNMWIRVHTHYAALAANEDQDVAPRAGGALQTRWSSFIRPEATFFMSLLVNVEKEEHKGWKDKDFIEEAKNRFTAIRRKEETDAMRAYSEAKQLAVLEDEHLLPKPRTKPTKFRYVHCISVLRTSKRFMPAVMLEQEPRVVMRSFTQNRKRHPKLLSDAEQAVNASEAFDDSVFRRDRPPPQHEPSPKRRKGSYASYIDSASEFGSSSSSSPIDLSSIVKAPMPNGVAVTAVTPSRVVASPAIREINVDAQNGRHISVKTSLLRIQHTQQKANYRLRLLNELRGIVETISQLAKLANGMEVSVGMTASSKLDPTLATEVQQDLGFFREQKQRLKQELDALDAEGMRRGKERWTHADDERLGRALLGVFDNQGEVAVRSDNRTLWNRVQQRYQELLTAEQVLTPDITAVQRSARSLHTRWARGICPDMILFSSLVDKMQKTGKRPTKAIKQAVKLFREQRSETNAAAVRQFVQERQRTPTASGDSETDSARPKLKFESFHFRHCYDILCSNAKFMEALLAHSRTNGVSEPLIKHCRTEVGSGSPEKYSPSTSSDESEAVNSHEGEEGVVLQKYPPASQFQVGSTSREHRSSWQNPPANANGVKRRARPSNAAKCDRGSVVITCEGASDDLESPRLECDRAMANEYVLLRMQTLKDDRRLKLLAELRGVVATIAQLAQQLAWSGVASAALTARTGGVCPALDQDVLRDIAFFRHEKQRLKQEIADLNDRVTNGTTSNNWTP